MMDRRMRDEIEREFENKCLWCNLKYRCGRDDARRCRQSVEAKVRRKYARQGRDWH